MADDYSAIADPVQAASDDYSSIATPLDHVDKTEDFSAIATPLVAPKKDLTEAEQLEAETKKNINEKGMNLDKVSTYNALRPSSILRGLKMVFSTPWESYKKSVDKGFETNLPEIHRYEAPTGTSAEDRALQVAAGTENVANAAASGVISPGGASMLNPITGPLSVLYATPRFLGGALESLGNVGKDKSAQENVENIAGGALGLVGAVAGGAHGIKGLKAQIPKVSAEVPKGPSLVAQMDGDTHGTPVEANQAANEIAMKPIQTPSAAPLPSIAGEAPPVLEAKPTIAEPTPAPVAETPVAAPEVAKVSDLGPEAAKAGPEKLAIIEKEMKNPDNVVQYSVYPAQEGFKDGKPFIAQVDLIDKKTGENTTSANSELLTELGHDVYQTKELPANIKPGAYTEPQLEAAIKDAKEEAQPVTKTKTQLMAEIKRKNPGADFEAPKQLMQPGKYEVRDIPIDEIGDVFGKSTIQPDVVAKYEKTPSSDPIILANVDGELRPVDGKHRFTAAVNRGDKTIKAYVPVDSEVGKPAAPKQIDPALKVYLDELLSTGEINAAEYKEQVGKAPAFKPKELSQDVPKMAPSPLQPASEAFSEAEPQLAQQQQGKPPTQESDALPKQSPESLPVPAQAEAGQEVGGQVRGGRVEATRAREADLLPKEDSISRTTAATEPEPKVLEPLVSPEGAQHVADDVEVNKILDDANGGEGPPPPEAPKGAAASGGGSPYRQGFTRLGLGLGKAAEAFKVFAGTIEGNIRDANKRVFGVLRNYENAKSQLSLQFEKATMPASRLARKILTKSGNDVVGNLLMSGQIDQAKALVAKETRYGAEFSAAIDAARSALDNAHRISSDARDGGVTYIQNYFPRQMISYAEFRKFLGKDELSLADQAIRRAEEKSKTPLTREDVEKVVNDLISESRRGGGKPGFLKPRTIDAIDANISRFYEPWDVALENYLRKVTNDVVNRAYFGKFDPASGEVYNPANGHFGKVIAEEIEAGRLKGKAQDIVIDNLQDRFKMEQNVQGLAADIGRKIRWAQSAAYLGQLQTAVAQFGDIFGSLLHQGPLDTARGYITPRFGLRDIGIHEGNVETAQFSRRKGLVDKASDLTIKFGVGLSDQFNKGGVANAIALHYADVVKNPMSDTFRNLNRDYSAKFPDQWPQMLKELKTKAFADGKLADLPNAQFFLYNEMADIHPINPSGMAQGFNAAHPLAKPFWGLKSYMIKQLDIMRARGYEKVKTPGQRGEGLAYLAAYAAVVAAGQNFAVSWLRDKLANRETDTSDYFIGGFLQPLGISRYTITQLKQGEVGKAIIETVLPIVSLGREVVNDAGLTRDLLIDRRDKKTRQKTVKDLGDLVSQSELVKHFPVVGSLFYSRFGKGAAKEKQRQAQKARGISQPNTLETIQSIASPKETAGH